MDTPPSRPAWRSALAVVAVLLVGLTAGFLLAGGRGGEDGGAPGEDVEGGREASEPEGSANQGGEPAALPSLEPLMATAEEAEVREALTRFLDAEATGDYETSFELLSQADRETYGVVAQWSRAHADLPPITGAEVTEVGRRGGGVVARSSLTLDSTLNTFVGLVPARAVGTWAMTEEDGGWRVRFDESTLRGTYPPDEDAAPAARQWVTAYAEQCRRPDDAAYDGPLYGSDFLLDDLCGADGEPDVQSPQRLAEDDQATAFVAAFGPEVYGWARVVPVAAGGSLRLVLAPVDDRWSVIGVLQP